MRYSWIAAVVLLIVLGACKEDRKPRILVFSKTNGYRHASIEPGKLAMIKLGTENGIDVDTTEDATAFTEDNLMKYNAVMFLNTTQNVLNSSQQADFKRFIEAGGGFVGIHAAADTEYDWPWYGRLVGAYFKSHPQIQEAKVIKVRPFGPKTLPDVWVRTDEWYNYKNISPDINVIHTVDETSYKGGENGKDHPIAWYHEFEGGRSFYTGLGHTDESYSDSLFLSHVLQGIQYVLEKKEDLDYKKVRTKRAIDENRFSKTVLDFNLNEPTEMTILPDGKVMFIERKGAVKLYSPSTNKVDIINNIETFTKNEDGLIGLTADPDFEKNHFIYLFYAHPQRSANVLSRFVFKDDKLDLSTEKEILEVATQRQECCHTGGSLQFGNDRVLFISTGDNTNPHKSNGYSPSDQQPGRQPFDAQSSAANTNDLRGKILRIIVNEDGSYGIPEGNLFAKGQEKTRPEIYIMGNRNPYRISFDKQTGYLYWGEVGPDAKADDSLRGPRGYDEINQAKKAGFYGWPYFVGDNYPYTKYDFASQKSLEKWDAARPVNESPNNTGIRDLPAAQPALIWYPYDKSDKFPMVREGGRNAMAGPIYYSADYKGKETAFPDYFDGKVLIYDWMRNWMFHLTLDEQGKISDMEPFMPGTTFNNIIDMAYGPDGRLYMVEYGTAWFKQNIDARLIRIDYNPGNRVPVIQLAADKTYGSVPLTVNFSAAGSKDYDGDKISYELEAANQKLTSDDGKFTVTFDKPGVYDVKLTGKDSNGLSSNAIIKVTAGNEPPGISFKITSGNKMFFFPGSPVGYEVVVADKEDGSTVDGKIQSDNVKVTFDYMKGFDMTEIAQGHQTQIPEHPGKSLMDKSDCKSCHLVNQESAGPSYLAVATKYSSDPNAVDKLADKIIRGGGGVWGSREMAAHPQISVDDARKMVQYIMALQQKDEQRLPLKGSVTPDNETDGAYFLTASYSDNAVSNVPGLAATQSYVLRSPSLRAKDASELHGGLTKFTYQGNTSLDNVKHNSHAKFSQVDLTNIRSGVAAAFVMPGGDQVGGDVEVRLDRPDGPVWGKAKITGQGMLRPSMKFTPQTGLHDVYIVFLNPQAGEKSLFFFGELRLSNK